MLNVTRLWLIGASLLLHALQLSAQDESRPVRCCWVVGIAMNQEREFSEDWNQFAEEIVLLFESQNEELYQRVETRTVLGREATYERIVETVNWAFLSAREDDLVVVYVSCHGGTTRADGWGIDTMDEQVVWGRDIKLAAARVRSPILFLIDTCESGGFWKSHANDVELPANCAALCSSRARQSTTNVLNTSMNEGLWGAGDFDGDGFIRVDELKRYVEARARRLAPEAEKPNESERPVIVLGDEFPVDLRLTRRSPDLVAVIYRREWYLARKLGEEGNQVSLHVMGYQDNPEKDYFLFNSADRNRVFPYENNALPVMAQREGELRPALCLAREGDQVTVRFPQNPREEAITMNRSEIQLPFPAPPVKGVVADDDEN